MKTYVNMVRRSTLILFVTIILICASALNAVTIKIASIVPAKSPWANALDEIGREWKKITNGQVDIRVYPGGIAGSEEDTIRKIRMGALGGAMLSNFGMQKILKDVYVLNIPFMIHSDDELNYVLERLQPHLEKQIEALGFKVVIWSSSGWVKFFSKDPLVYPEDLKKHKLSFATGEPELEQSFKKAGFHIVPIELKDLMMGLQSGMVNAFYLPPLIAASGQYFGITSNMCPLDVAPIIGGIVISERVWKQIPVQFHAEMTAVTQKLSKRLLKEAIELEQEAIDTMVENGLKINALPPDAPARWAQSIAEGTDELIGEAFSRDIYDRVVSLLTEYRNKSK